MISYWCIGGSSDDDKVRRIGWDIPAKGWKHVVDTVLARDIPTMLRLGHRPRVLLHNPFGQEPGGAMRLDQFVRCARSDRVGHVASNFVPMWEPVMRLAELILYFGYGDQPVKPRTLRDTPQISRWVSPCLELGASVGIDCLGVKQADELDAQIAAMAEEEMIPVYYEGGPLPHWHDRPVIMQTNNDDIERLAYARRTAETIILDPNMSVEGARVLQRLGYTPCVPLHQWIDAKADLSPLGGKAAA